MFGVLHFKKHPFNHSHHQHLQVPCTTSPAGWPVPCRCPGLSRPPAAVRCARRRRSWVAFSTMDGRHLEGAPQGRWYSHMTDVDGLDLLNCSCIYWNINIYIYMHCLSVFQLCNLMIYLDGKMKCIIYTHIYVYVYHLFIWYDTMN